MNISVIIPTYKNKEMLLRNLQHNLPFLVDCEVILVNDYPEESLVEDLKQFPQVKLIENEKNLGFGPTVNNGVESAKNPYVLLLNNDVLLSGNFYVKALSHFEKDATLFAVSFAQKEKDGAIVGKNRMYWEQGFFQHSKADDLSFGINAWAEGGSCLIDRAKYIDLKGFDDLYSPFYWEDIDLSYRAWKKGYTIIFDPGIVVQHHHESTIGKYYADRIQTTAFRNQLLFMWKNIQDQIYLQDHKKHLFLFLAKSLLQGKFSYIKGWWQAISRKSKIQKGNYVKSDKEILDMFV